MSLDDSIDPINRSRSCDETSFFEVLDEINSTVAHQPDRLVVQNRRVQIVPKQRSTSNAPSIASTPAEFSHQTNVSSNEPTSLAQKGSDSTQQNTINANRTSSDTTSLSANVNNTGSNNLRPNIGPLSVAKLYQMADDSVAFYVSPFTPDQNDADIKKYIHDIANVDASLVKVVKLVPRGKRLEDLSFISFKVIVGKTVSNVVGDPWYWPEGVTVRMFDHNQKNGSATARPNQS